MSDTMTVKTLCDHRRADPHYIEHGNRVCPGGKEIVLRRPTDDEWIWDSVLEQDEVWVEANDE